MKVGRLTIILSDAVGEEGAWLEDSDQAHNIHYSSCEEDNLLGEGGGGDGEGGGDEEGVAELEIQVPEEAMDVKCVSERKGRERKERSDSLADEVATTGQDEDHKK